MGLITIRLSEASEGEEKCFSTATVNHLTTKTSDVIFVSKFVKNVRSELYHIENSKTRGQTV